MAVSMAQQMMSALPQLRYQPTHKHVRVRLDDGVVADTDHAVLVWEPMRVVPSYAVPLADITASLRPATPGPVPEYRAVGFGPDSPPLLDPSVPFDVHTADLRGYVVLDFDVFEWWEEDEQIVGHPRDPFHRIDVRPSSRAVRIEHEGQLLAESDRCQLLFEGVFPLVRHYLPAEDVRVDLLPSTLRTTCAYKGHATHYSVRAGDRELADIAWSYDDPLDDALPVRGLISFYQERLDLTIDGQRVDRVRTPWS